MAKKKIDLITREILNTREAASLLKVTTQTIKNYIYSGKLKAIKTPGGHHRVRRVDLEGIGFISEEDNYQVPLTPADMLNSYETMIKTLVSTIEAFTKALDMRDVIFTGHSARVDNISSSIGKSMGLSGKELQDLKLASLLHDVGKVGISESILGKPGQLTDQEFFLIKQHPEIGGKIVGGIEQLRSVASTIRHHHEKFDGSGYPDGLAGSEIELYARIISVVETYDFMRSDLSFRKAVSVEDTLREIKTCSGTQFDPEVVEHFVAMVGKDGNSSEAVIH
jgi:excisionase family DNA binding protein